jgi:hypothetical protein
MNFNLNDAPESNFPVTNTTNTPKSTYQKPGIYDNVRITEVVLGASSLNKIPYLELRTAGDNGELGKSNRMWLSTTIGKNLDGSPKKTSGWGITARNIVDLIIATHNVTRDEAKSMIDITEENKEKAQQMLVNKISNLLVGRPFRAKFKGEQGKPREDGSAGLVFATLDLVESMNIPKESSVLRFDSVRDVKAYTAWNSPAETESNTNSVEQDSLPF